MCGLGLVKLIEEVAQKRAASKGMFCAADIVAELRADESVTELFSHREVAVELFKIFQDGKLPSGYVAQPVTAKIDEKDQTFVAYRWTRYAHRNAAELAEQCQSSILREEV